MHLRALIVLLLVMNVGVALWWALRPAPAAEPAPAVPGDVPTLVLEAEADRELLQAAALDAANAAAQPDEARADSGDRATVAPEDLRCFSFGPWEGADEAGQAQAGLRVEAVRIRAREAITGATGWQVRLPPLADRAAAEAMVARLVAAGFNDHFILGQGDQANAVALGRFGAEASARRHQAALHEAGFDAALVEPVGATGTETWLDLAVGPDFDPDQARVDSGAARAEPLDCAALQ